MNNERRFALHILSPKLLIVQIPAQRTYLLEEVRAKILKAISGQEQDKVVEPGIAAEAPVKTNAPAVSPILAADSVADPLCPKCKASMVRRKMKTGNNAGQVFWGCSTYPSAGVSFRIAKSKGKLAEGRDHMKPDEVQFLIAEYNHCWLLINAIDERRGKFLQSITAVVIAVIGAVGFLVSGDGVLPLRKTLEASALLFLTLVGVCSIITILKAERQANIKRRKWVNLIRQMFLANSDDRAVIDYFSKQENKELGIKIPGDNEPDDIGSTLINMFVFLGIEIVVLVVAFYYVWARHYGYIQ